LEDGMTASARSQQSRRLLQLGVALLLFSALDGFAIPFFASPRIGLSVHTLSGLQAVIFLGFGLLWPKLNLGPRALRVAFWCAAYSALAILAAYVIAAIWGVGNETIKLMGELPHGLSRGSAFQEGLIKVVAYTSAPTGLLAFTLILWGLRTVDPQRDHAELYRVERSGRTG
jgi:hydroxylaminobenzene mutase